MVGVRGGVSVCKMMGVPKMLVSEGYYSGYTFSEDYSVCPAAGIFFSYTIRNAPVGLEARFNYDQLKGSATYDDIEGFTYTTEATFHAIGASAHIKGYAYKGFYLSVGIGYCWNLILGKFTYSSNSGDMDWGGQEVPTDRETAEELAEAFSGNGCVFLPLALGYELPNSMSLEAFSQVRNSVEKKHGVRLRDLRLRATERDCLPEEHLQPSDLHLRRHLGNKI